MASNKGIFGCWGSWTVTYHFDMGVFCSGIHFLQPTNPQMGLTTPRPQKGANNPPTKFRSPHSHICLAGPVLQGGSFKNIYFEESEIVAVFSRNLVRHLLTSSNNWSHNYSTKALICFLNLNYINLSTIRTEQRQKNKKVYIQFS